MGVERRVPTVLEFGLVALFERSKPDTFLQKGVEGMAHRVVGPA